MCQKTFHQHSVRPGDLLSIFGNFPCGRETFWQFLSTFSWVGRPSLTFRVDGSPFLNFRQLSVRPGDIPSALISMLS